MLFYDAFVRVNTDSDKRTRLLARAFEMFLDIRQAYRTAGEAYRKALTAVFPNML